MSAYTRRRSSAGEYQTRPKEITADTSSPQRKRQSLDATALPRQQQQQLLQQDNQAQKQEDEKMVEKRQELRRYLRSRFGTTQKAFAAIDPDGVGHLSKNDLAKSLKRLQIPWVQITGVTDVSRLFQPSRRDGSFLVVYDVVGSLEELDEDDADDSSEDTSPRLRSQRGFEDVDNVKLFAKWASEDNRWDQLHSMFHTEDRNMYVIGGIVGRRRMPLEEWVDKIRCLGFKGDALGIFREIIRERNQADDAHSRVFSCGDERVSLRQLKHFEARAKALNCALRVTEDGSPGMRFLDVLRTKRGNSLLRAWRLDIDIRGTGRVALVDFSACCRRLGVVREAKAIWTSIRGKGRDRTPLEFHELAPDEASNMEEFTTILWATVGLDLEQAWTFMDVNNQNVLRYDDFSRGARTLGFKGDVKLLFNGLDASGLGQVWRAEFEYLAKVSRTAQQRLKRSSNLTGCNELISWVQRELGGAEVLIVKLGLSQQCREISVSDLAARLTALGFPGDALYVAVRAVRSEGGTAASADSLYAMLSGGRHSKPGTASPSSPRKQAATTARAVSQHAWCDGVDDLSCRNYGKGRYTKSYFSSPNRLEGAFERDALNARECAGVNAVGRTLTQGKSHITMDHRASMRNNPLKGFRQKDWDSSLAIGIERNIEMPPSCREYFSNPSPLRRGYSDDLCRSPMSTTAGSISPRMSPTSNNGTPFQSFSPPPRTASKDSNRHRFTPDTNARGKPAIQAAYSGSDESDDDLVVIG